MAEEAQAAQITMRRVDGWKTLDQAPVKQPIVRRGLCVHQIGRVEALV